MNITKTEIEQKAKSVWKSISGQQNYKLGLYDGFIEGAEWLRQQLLQQTPCYMPLRFVKRN